MSRAYWDKVPSEERKTARNTVAKHTPKHHPILFAYAEAEEDKKWKAIFDSMARGRYSNITARGNDIILRKGKRGTIIFKLSDTNAEELKHFLTEHKLFSEKTTSIPLRETDYLWEEYNKVNKKELLMAFCKRKTDKEDVYNLYNKINGMISSGVITNKDIVIKDGKIKTICYPDFESSPSEVEYNLTPICFPIILKSNKDFETR